MESLDLFSLPNLANCCVLISIGAPKVYVVLGLGFVYFFMIFLNYGGQLLTNLAGFLIPGYYSLNALFTLTKVDDTQWLTYVLILLRAMVRALLFLTQLPH